MTTTVKIHAHCSGDKEVTVSIADKQNGNVKEVFTLQDGEQADLVVYDDLQISVSEVLK